LMIRDGVPRRPGGQQADVAPELTAGERRLTLRPRRLVPDLRGLLHGSNRVLDAHQHRSLERLQGAAARDRHGSGCHSYVVRRLPQVVAIVLAEGEPEAVKLAAHGLYVLCGCLAAVLWVLHELGPCRRGVAEPGQVERHRSLLRSNHCGRTYWLDARTIRLVARST